MEIQADADPHDEPEPITHRQIENNSMNEYSQYKMNKDSHNVNNDNNIEPDSPEPHSSIKGSNRRASQTTTGRTAAVRHTGTNSGRAVVRSSDGAAVYQQPSKTITTTKQPTKQPTSSARKQVTFEPENQDVAGSRYVKHYNSRPLSDLSITGAISKWSKKQDDRMKKNLKEYTERNRRAKVNY